MMQGIVLILLQSNFRSLLVISLHGVVLLFLLEPTLEATTIDAHAISIAMLHMDFLFHLYRILCQSVPSLSYINTFTLPTMPTAEINELMKGIHRSWVA